MALGMSMVYVKAILIRILLRIWHPKDDLIDHVRVRHLSGLFKGHFEPDFRIRRPVDNLIDHDGVGHLCDVFKGHFETDFRVQRPEDDLIDHDGVGHLSGPDPAPRRQPH